MRATAPPRTERLVSASACDAPAATCAGAGLRDAPRGDADHRRRRRGDDGERPRLDGGLVAGDRGHVVRRVDRDDVADRLGPLLRGLQQALVGSRIGQERDLELQLRAVVHARERRDAVGARGAAHPLELQVAQRAAVRGRHAGGRPVDRVELPRGARAVREGGHVDHERVADVCDVDRLVARRIEVHLARRDGDAGVVAKRRGRRRPDALHQVAAVERVGAGVLAVVADLAVALRDPRIVAELGRRHRGVGDVREVEVPRRVHVGLRVRRRLDELVARRDGDRRELVLAARRAVGQDGVVDGRLAVGVRLDLVVAAVAAAAGAHEVARDGGRRREVEHVDRVRVGRGILLAATAAAICWSMNALRSVPLPAPAS